MAMSGPIEIRLSAILDITAKLLDC